MNCDLDSPQGQLRSFLFVGVIVRLYDVIQLRMLGKVLLKFATGWRLLISTRTSASENRGKANGKDQRRNSFHEEVASNRSDLKRE